MRTKTRTVACVCCTPLLQARTPEPLPAHLPAGVSRDAAEAGQVRIAVGAQEHVQRDLPAAGLPSVAFEEGVFWVAQLRLTLCVVEAQVVAAGLELAGAQAGQAGLEQQQLAAQVAHHQVGGLAADEQQQKHMPLAPSKLRQPC